MGAWMRGCCWSADYRLERPIGAGGMGHVWAANDTRLGRDVALKVQQFDPAGDRVAFERFQREAQSTAALQHPNVVTIFDSGTEGDTAFLVMELLPGPTLEAYVDLSADPCRSGMLVALAGAIASGLSAAHHAGVVHRDIKPTNLMFDARGGQKIVDFGIARLAQTAAARLTATKTVIGSAPYLSPEQLTGRPADERSDLYALGCVMTTMLTGRPLLLEGEAGVGKTELAKVLAASLGARLIRLQCYEGLDVNTAVYEWNYPRQMLEIRLLEARGDADQGDRPRHLQLGVPHPPAAPPGARGR